MTRHRSFLLCLALTAVAFAAAPDAPAGPAHAQESTNAAALVVDTGSEVKRVCVRFREESISGSELLERADVDPVFADHGSMGKAVCALCGTGCPADDCFCESDSSGRHWHYLRGNDGAWQESSRGASSTTVRHGDVEGWAWGGSGARPPYEEFETVCGPPPSTEGTSPSPSPRSDSDDDDSGTSSDDEPPAREASGDREAAERGGPGDADDDGQRTGPRDADGDDSANGDEEPNPSDATSGETARTPEQAGVGSPTTSVSERAAPGGVDTIPPSADPDDAPATSDVRSPTPSPSALAARGGDGGSGASSFVLFALVVGALGAALWWRRTSGTAS